MEELEVDSITTVKRQCDLFGRDPKLRCSSRSRSSEKPHIRTPKMSHVSVSFVLRSRRAAHAKSRSEL